MKRQGLKIVVSVALIFGVHLFGHHIFRRILHAAPPVTPVCDTSTTPVTPPVTTPPVTGSSRFRERGFFGSRGFVGGPGAVGVAPSPVVVAAPQPVIVDQQPSVVVEQAAPQVIYEQAQPQVVYAQQQPQVIYLPSAQPYGYGGYGFQQQQGLLGGGGLLGGLFSPFGLGNGFGGGFGGGFHHHH